MIRRLLSAALLLGALHPGIAAARGDAAAVVVQDPYLELRSGPGRGFPVVQVVDRGREVDLLRQRTDWIKVRGSDGVAGWVHRSQLERTLTPAGEPVELPGPTPESRTEHRWELGMVVGDLEGAHVVGAQGGWAMTPTLLVRADAAQLLGNYSNGWIGTIGIAHVFAPQWRISPFVGIGGGVLHVEPKATLVQPEDRTDGAAYAAAGLRGYLTNRFLLQAEYRQFVVFTSRDDNEEIDQWTVSFVYFF